jgi:hypothetical protein
MNAIYPGLALAAAFAYFSSDVLLPSPGLDDIVVSTVQGLAHPPTRFKLFSSERPGGCVISVAGEGPATQEFSADRSCGLVHPDLLTATAWQERSDGSVALRRPDGGVVVELAAADGASFESYNPPSPILVFIPD